MNGWHCHQHYNLAFIVASVVTNITTLSRENQERSISGSDDSVVRGCYIIERP